MLTLATDIPTAFVLPNQIAARLAYSSGTQTPLRAPGAKQPGQREWGCDGFVFARSPERLGSTAGTLWRLQTEDREPDSHNRALRVAVSKATYTSLRSPVVCPSMPDARLPVRGNPRSWHQGTGHRLPQEHNVSFLCPSIESFMVFGEQHPSPGSWPTMLDERLETQCGAAKRMGPRDDWLPSTRVSGPANM
jgi:hypothetical protein